MGRHHRNSSDRTLRAIIGGLVIVMLVVILVLVATNRAPTDGGEASSPAPAPAPAPPPMAVACDWCDDLIDRLGKVHVAASAEDASMAMSACHVLTQADFANGTYIMETDDACYTLAEDIVFHPSPTTDFRATEEPYASDPSFVLDFHSAILVRAVGVSIDLGGFEIRQSVEHYMQQRFYAHIELTTPFIGGQGPADFTNGGTPTSAMRFALRNGRLGLSSHHGIHGNDLSQVVLEDLVISDYEVGAIALNGATDVLIRRVVAKGTFTRVPVAGTYSAARFMMPFIHRALALGASNGTVGAQVATLDAAHTQLVTLMGHALSDVLATGEISHPGAKAIFGNKAKAAGLPDGSASYGIVLHAHGVAINGFECDRTDARHDKLHHILIEDCEIRNTEVATVETPVTFAVDTGKIQRGPAGDVLRIAEAFGNSGEYVPNVMADNIIALDALVTALGRPAGFGTLTVHPVIHAWARGDTDALANAVSSGTLGYMRNGDTMFHVNKGAIGIRIGGGHHVAVRRTLLAGVFSGGPTTNMDPLPGETVESAYWTSADDGGHPGAAPQQGYGGADAAGITIAAAGDVVLDTVTVRDVASLAGWSSGIYVFNDAYSTLIHDSSIVNITAHVDLSVQVRTPKNPRAVGLVTTTDASEPTITGSFDISGVVIGGSIGMGCNELKDNTGIEKCSPPETNFYTM